LYNLIIAILDKRQHVVLDVPIAVVMLSSIFWNVTPCRPLKVNGRFERVMSPLGGWQEKFSLSLAFTLVSCLAYFWTLKLEATCFFETPFNFRQTTRIFIPEDRIRRKIKYFKMNGNKNVWN
jgi:hypothetical protein